MQGTASRTLMAGVQRQKPFCWCQQNGQPL